MCSVRLRVQSHIPQSPRKAAARCVVWRRKGLLQGVALYLASFRVSRCGSKGCRVVLLSLLEDQRARAPVKDASEACTVVLFADRLHDPYEVSASLQNIQWLDSKNGSSMMRRTRSLVHAAVRSYSPSSSLRLASVGGPVNACDTFHVHAR